MNIGLIIGINHYKNTPLRSCVSSALNIAEILKQNDDLSPNFNIKSLLSSEKTFISRKLILENVKTLLSHNANCAVIYFAGYGLVDDNNDTSLMAQDSTDYYDSVAYNEIVHLVNQSNVREVIIILDCFFNEKYNSLRPSSKEIPQLRNGVSILANSVYNDETGPKVFTNLLLEAIDGEASDMLGNVTISGVFNYLQTRLGPWDQRPIFKSHISHNYPIRKSKPRISWSTLRSLTEIFPDPEFEFALNPSFEKTSEKGIPENILIFSYLQQFANEGIVKPVGEDHMYFAAVNSKSVRLTQTGKLYWKLLRDQRI